jgi:hypothetical protein
MSRVDQCYALLDIDELTGCLFDVVRCDIDPPVDLGDDLAGGEELQ